MFTNAAKIVEVPVFTLKSLSKEAQNSAYEQWSWYTHDNLAESDEFTAFKELVDGLHESFGFILYDKHGEKQYVNEEFEMEESDLCLEHSIDDDGCFINTIEINFNSLLGDSKEEIASYLNRLVEAENHLGLDNKYQAAWGDSVSKNYQNEIELLGEANLGTRDHFDRTIKSMADAFKTTLSTFQLDMKALHSKEVFEKETAADALFLVNGEAFTIRDTCTL